MSKKDEDATFYVAAKNPMHLLKIYHKLIKSYGVSANLKSKVCCYKGFDFIHRPILYHRLNQKVYSEKHNTIHIKEEILDDLIERGVNDIIFIDYKEEYGWGDHISVSTTTFINEGVIHNGKVYLALEYFDYLGTEYIPYIPIFSRKCDENDYKGRNQTDVPSERIEGRQKEEDYPMGDQEETDAE